MIAKTGGLLIIPAFLLAGTIFLSPRPAIARSVDNSNNGEVPSDSFSYRDYEASHSPWDSARQWVRNHTTEAEGPPMLCDEYGYRCDPNPAYYGKSAYNYQQYPYYWYQDGLSDQPADGNAGSSSNYSFDGIPLMGGF